ncbi:hypothetical protein Poli38472_000158 [Pythium oligandrum]|uniref:STI1 domain-containing protein n=1 Tax=Pythium oligandrum TaxID=41045 RepID=A0A8K1CBX4_PYTOL|nr:hypothetical protein Poli38472_000158 [Pythium oligandrum]|eukprot:TMW60116.1 hypothetical protein Poli38472_000158 [Pythium oligandrum]
MSLDANAKTALFNALAWIERTKHDAGVDTENIEVGLQCLAEAFKLNLHDAEHKNAYEVVGATSFPEIFTAGMEALGLATKGSDDSVDQDPVVTKNPDLWKKWLAKLDDKGFFNGAPVGSDEYKTRTKKALGKFKEKFGDVKPAAPSLTKEQKEAKAEELKAQGNSALNGGDYEKAAKLYKEAITLSSDGPNSHIYYSNHAAALMYLGKYHEVVDNCEKSIELKPSYVKAYSRMGSAQLHLKDFHGAIDSFRRGLEVDSSNAACRDGLADAERKLNQQQGVANTSAGSNNASGAGGMGGMGGMPDLGGLASMLGGGGGGLADLMNNPAMMQMAQSMMQNPAMMQMAQNVMQNPDMLSSMMNNLGGGGGGAGAGAGGAGGMPDMAGMANAIRNSPELMAARSDPDLQDFFRDVDQEGPSAAMRHMSNPKVSQLIQNAMARMG